MSIGINGRYALACRLPKGAVKSVEKLQILDTQGRFVPALFAVANRWWEDGSIQWVHCDFAATVAANSQTGYVLREVVALPEFPSPMGFIPRGKAFEVITGPLRFAIGGDSNQLIDQVWVDEGWGYNFNEQTKILDSGNFDHGADQWWSCLPHRHWTQNRIEVEEHNALRAVVKITGSFALADLKERRLDYIARLTTYGGKTYFKLEMTLLNRRDAEFPIDELSLSFKLNLDLTQQKFILEANRRITPGISRTVRKRPCRRIRPACIPFPEQCREVAQAGARAWAGWICRTASTDCLQR